MLFGGYSKSLFGTRKIDERTKDIPLEGNLVAATYILTYEKTFATPDFSKSLPAAYLVRWYNEGKVRFEDGRLVFADMPAPKGKAEKNYYDLFTQAAGDDHVIGSREDVKKTFYIRFTKVPSKDELLSEIDPERPPLSWRVREQVNIQIRYEGYIQETWG